MSGDWRTIFGHAEPYDDQVDGVETAVEVADRGGFLVLEGACGTGKTMLALTAGLDRVRDPDSAFERVVVLTSVRQQLRQFEADLETINDDLPEDWRPVSGLTLVGKADVCPYSRERLANVYEANVYDRCEGVRDRTRALSRDGPTTAAALASQARSQQVDLASVDADASYLATAGESSPYPPEMPEYEDVEFCPFYAQYLDDLPEDGDPAEAVPFDPTEVGLLATEDLVARSVAHGTCPHSMMGALLGQVEVVIGNYYHAFDPTTTGAFTGALLDSSTFVICDEAHMLESRVRDLVSDGVADRSLRRVETELTRVIQPVARPGEAVDDADLIRAELDESEIPVSDLEAARTFVRDLREEVDRRVTQFLDREHPSWQRAADDLPDAEMPLRDPETPEPDGLTEWAESAGYGASDWTRLEGVGPVVGRILDELDDEDRDRAAPGAGRTLAAWYRRDHERFFREIELERTWDGTEPSDSWRRVYNARLAIQNCVPSDAIGERLGEFGGGVLMSATLEPLDVFAEVTGLNHLAEEADRPVVTRTYGLDFPAANRASFAVDAPKFTHANRGAASEDTAVRQTYARILRQVAASPGNVLVGMPNYAEAAWAADVLDDAVDKEVLVDESSGDDATEALKSEFFAGESKVLVTSLRGTLTEGVDYSGEKLRAAVICGVPIVNTASPHTRAVRTAYDRTFGDGFRYALAIPAVRKARQAVGRVIRGPDDVGVRVLVDERYAREDWDSVRDLLPEQTEFRPVSTDMLSLGLERFWDGVE